MQNNLIKVEEKEFKDNEVDIYKIINISLKNIKLLIIVSIIGIVVTCLYIGKRIIYDKNNILTMEYSLNYSELESYLGGKVFYPRKNSNQILLEDKYIEKLFENKYLKELYERNIKENKDDTNTKRQFLIDSKVLEIIPKRVDEKDEKSEIIVNAYKIVVKVSKREDINNEVSYNIMNAYLEVLKEYYNENIFKYIEERKSFSDKRLQILKKELEENSVMIDSLNFDRNTIAESNFLRYIYPNKVSNIDAYYPEYVKLEAENQAIKTLFELKLNNIDKFIQYNTSIIFEREKSGNFLVLGIGVFISLLLSRLIVCIKEFLVSYKNKKE